MNTSLSADSLRTKLLWTAESADVLGLRPAARKAVIATAIALFYDRPLTEADYKDLWKVLGEAVNDGDTSADQVVIAVQALISHATSTGVRSIGTSGPAIRVLADIQPAVARAMRKVR